MGNTPQDVGTGMGGAGRRLEVRVQPAFAFATWWFRPQGDGLRQAAADGGTPDLSGPRSVLCGFGDGVPVGPWRAWPTLAGREYDGADAERVLLTVSQRIAGFFRAGRPVDVLPRAGQAPPRPVPAGVLDGPATNPEWLLRALLEYRRPRGAAGLIVGARHRWQHRVHGCSVTADGRELWCTVNSHRDEVLAGFDVEQTSERVAVRAWLAFGPDGPTTFGRGRTRVLPDGRKVSTMFRQASGRRWSTVVPLDEPLGTRPVVDVAAPDPGASGKARLAWLAERDGTGTESSR
ncbi:hypothetical protein MXD62_26140 [Frankia sp. Mgl5]|uniref:hypothetical protein n=1 Tax=Frankia sp. Mgl5 TaxID=2933793 RepID=UPI00200E27CC|nr:hypothetical protein [Frankia sp. Mgl5]MCK9930603.1 hypothetical protein [Frankia sp. Mgl5]